MEIEMSQLCKCGNKPTITYSDGSLYCNSCDPDPDIDNSEECCVTGCKNHPVRSGYIGAGIYLGICEQHDHGEPLGFLDLVD